MSVNLLDRLSARSDLSFLQSQVDGLVGSFTKQATDGLSLASMTAAGAAYRLARVGGLALGSGNILRAASVGLGLAAEVSAFELAHRALKPETQNLWRWNGAEGLKQGLLHSFIAFGTLKGAGYGARSQNIVLQHFAQDTAMVAGHQISGALELTSPPTGSLAEQFLHAEATNLQIGAGMALVRGAAPGLHGLERGLDVSLQAADRLRRGSPLPITIGNEAFAASGPAGDLKIPASFVVQMSAREGQAEKGEKSNPPSRKGPIPPVERFSRMTELSRMEISAPPQKAIESLEAVLREATPRPLAIIFEGTGDPSRIISRLQYYLKERHGRKLLPQDFALALLFSAQEKGTVLYPHGVELKSEEAGRDLIKRLKRIADGAAAMPTGPKPAPEGIFQFRGVFYRIEGTPADSDFKAVSPRSADPIGELKEAVRRHLKSGNSRSLVFSFDLEFVDPVEMRIELLKLLRELDPPKGLIITAALVNDGTAFLFERKEFHVQVYRSPIRSVSSRPEAEKGETPVALEARQIPRADTLGRVFDLFKRQIQGGQRPEVLFEGENWNLKTLNPKFAQWLQFPQHLLPRGQSATVHMPNLRQSATGSTGQSVIFLWQGDRIGWQVEPLGEAKEE